MPEHYDPRVLARTKDLYAAIRAWALGRADVTVIGGWAVYEHVVPGKAMQSRDVDIVLHSEEALHALQGLVPALDLTWRTTGRRMYPDAHFQDEDPLEFRLDVFTSRTNPTWERLFARHGAANVKPCPPQYLPPLEWLIADKLHTVHSRHGADAADKRTKDLIDVHHLVFHNRANATPMSLARSVLPSLRRAALACIDEAITTRPPYAEELQQLAQWLAA